MFHRVRVIFHNFENLNKYKPMTIKDTNLIVDLIDDYIQVCYYVENEKANKKFWEEQKQQKYQIETELLKLGMKYKLIDFANGQGKNKKHYTIEVVREVLKYHLDRYFTALLKYLTYIVSNIHKDKVKQKHKLYLMNKEYGIEANQINETKQLGFIL